MSVGVSCPSCQKEYKVKADAAGKKFRCKACQSVVTVPQAEPGELDLLGMDPWDAVDEDAPPPELPPRRTRSSTAGKTKKRSSSDGMPVTVMVSIGICGLFLAMNLYAGFASIFMNDGSKAQAGGSLFRLIVDVVVIKGLLERSNRIRWNSIILDIIGLVFMMPCLGLILVGSQIGAVNDIGVGQKVAAIAIIALNIVLWIVDIVMLTHRSASDYCNQ